MVPPNFTRPAVSHSVILETRKRGCIYKPARGFGQAGSVFSHLPETPKAGILINHQGLGLGFRPKPVDIQQLTCGEEFFSIQFPAPEPG